MTHPLAVVCIIGSCISLQLGAALAIQLFPLAGARGTAAVRLLLAGLLLLVLTRPKFHTWTRKQCLGAALFGASLGMRNGLFYKDTNPIPLRTPVTMAFHCPMPSSARVE